MSWWDTSGFTNLASQALKNAQKKIDKVLDISEDAAAKKRESQLSSAAPAQEEAKGGIGEPEDGDFWSGWLGAGGKKSEVQNIPQSSASHSSWGIPWNLPGSSSLEQDAGQLKTIISSTDTPHETESCPAEPDVILPATSESNGQSASDLTLEFRHITTPDKCEEDSSVSYNSSELLRVDAHASGESQTLMVPSDDFASGWQDFPLDADVPDEEESAPASCLLPCSDEVQRCVSPTWHLTSDVEHTYTDTCQPMLHSSDSSLSSDALTRLGSDLANQSTNRENEIKDKDNQVPPVIGNITSETLLASIHSSLVQESSSSPISSGICADYQSGSIFQEQDAGSVPSLSLYNNNLIEGLDKSGQSFGLSKASSSNSFIVVSEENTAEFVPSNNPSDGRFELLQTKSNELLPSDQFETLNDRNSLQPISHSSVTDNLITLLKQDSSAQPDEIESLDLLVQSTALSLKTIDKPDNPSKDLHQSHSGSMQDYLSVGQKEQTATLEDSSTQLPDELQTSTDTDMGNSRTSSDLDLPGGGRASSTGSSDTSKLDSSVDTVVDRSVLDSQSDLELADRDVSYSLFRDGQDGQTEVTSDDLLQMERLDDSSQSLGSSYVKCMIEEAMEDFSKIEDSGSDNHSSGEKSESSKVDSELEKSSHESSDEVETTTSSDIEIISAPASNGDSKYHMQFDLMPLKLSLQRGERDHSHQRSDSQSSSSAHSKVGEMEHMSPERGEGVSWRDEDFPHHDLHAVREEGPENPSHPERLLKLAHLVVLRKVQGGQKLAEMAEVLQARENKLVQLSKENHQLTEDNSILRNQLMQLEKVREDESADLTALTTEFTIRIGEAEKKIQALVKEKELFRQKLAVADKELERRSANLDLESLLAEKQEQVEELLKEGEKLSKQQLQSSNIIKKLRAKEKESDTTIATQKKKLEEQAKELEKLTAVLDSKEDLEKKQSEAINQLNAAVQKQEKELIRHKSDLEDAQEKCRGLQVALDNSYKELAELHRSNASQDSKAMEAALSAETQVREELKATMEREQQRFRQERETFIMQIDDLRLDMARLEKEHGRREDLLRQEIQHLQEQLQQDEARSQDLTQSVSSATRPLLRQIENLQTTFGAQSAAWERVEKSLSDRLAESQNALAMAQEKERTANDHLMELSMRVTSLETANARLKQDKTQLSAQVESDRSRLEELQDVRNSFVAQLESNKQRLVQELTQLKTDKVHLESQLNVERTRLENERKKTLVLEEQLRQAERPRSRGSPSPSPSMSVSRQESLTGSMYERQSPGHMSWSFQDDSGSTPTLVTPTASLYDSLRQSGAALVFENLSSQIKLREGEITHMQTEITQLERTRESMARELVNLTNQNEELLETKKSHELLQEQYNELNSRYSALLQMYGEKEEQVQELRLDLQDVKEMYKSQIDALLAK